MIFEELKQEYNKINNSFEKKCIYHVGVDGGFFSEVDAMMQCMLYCFDNSIKFVLYADDANWAGGHGWNEFFLTFCEENHNWLNKYVNPRFPINRMRIDKRFLAWMLKKIEKADYLTTDIFFKCIPREYSQNVTSSWKLFDINGTNFDEFAKLHKVALQYNSKTLREVRTCIDQVGLPDHYYSIQFRGGDKILEQDHLLTVDQALERIDDAGIKVESLFVFADDYRYIVELREKRPAWRIFSLTEEKERGYYNSDFQKKEWSIKRRQMIKLFSMVEICLKSDLHFGNEQTCVNNYIKSLKDKYLAIGFEEGNYCVGR